MVFDTVLDSTDWIICLDGFTLGILVMLAVYLPWEIIRNHQQLFPVPSSPTIQAIQAIPGQNG